MTAYAQQFIARLESTGSTWVPDAQTAHEVQAAWPGKFDAVREGNGWTLTTERDQHASVEG